jgi:transcriptional regulator with XRE-family HTH domain
MPGGLCGICQGQSRGRGRPAKPLDPDASYAAWLGAEIRKLRNARGLTQTALAAEIGFSAQHVSETELGEASASRPFIAACDDALGAGGRLLVLLPAVIHERETQRQDRVAARRAGVEASVRYGERAEGEEVDPTTRRGLIGAGAAATLGGLGAAAVPAAAREVDPELPAHLGQLLNLLGRHDEMFGPRDVLATVRHQLRLIAEHRKVARGQLRADLLRVEARWTEFASWLSDDTGDANGRDELADQALRLAQEAGYADMVAYARSRQSQWAGAAANPPRAIALAEDALRVRGTSAQTRAWCSLRAALGHALADDAESCERSLTDAYTLVEDAESPAPPWAGEFRYTATAVRAGESFCWLSMNPSKAVGLYEDVLREWPRDEMRGGGVHQARLALACAAAGDRSRAQAEGRKALTVARATKSATATRELKRLGVALGS